MSAGSLLSEHCSEWGKGGGVDLGVLKLAGVSSTTSVPMIQLAYFSQMDDLVVERKGAEGSSVVADTGTPYPRQASLVATAPLLSGERIQTGGRRGKDGNPLSPRMSERH